MAPLYAFQSLRLSQLLHFSCQIIAEDVGAEKACILNVLIDFAAWKAQQ